jgi:hypothetical protein
MKATPLSPAEIFGNQIRYVVPLFQRPYVWDEEKQWAPLWDDVARVAETVLETPVPAYGPRLVPPHFLGAVVVDQHHTGVNYIGVRGIVDGQQRMTTLQLLMDATQAVVAEHGDPQDAQALEVLVLNPAQLSPNKDERFKVWPTDRDQAAFRVAMDDGASVPADLKDSLIVQAHEYFTAQVREWAHVTDDPDVVRARLNALTVALRDFLKVVVIDLEPGDNAQVIFETLNHRGTPLLAADLVKNLVFQSAQAQGLDIQHLYVDSWSTLDSDYWRQDVAQGRLYRPRIDVFMQYWLTMRRLKEVATDRVFVEFRDYLTSPAAPSLPQLVGDLVLDAKVFAGLDKHSSDSVVGQFHYRILKALDSAAVTPFLLWLLRYGPEDCPTEQRDKALRAMESWLARRALCRYTAKGVNLLVVDLLRRLSDAGPVKAGDVTEQFLAAQTADARAWPTDAEVIRALTTQALYKNISRARLRMLLEALEDDLRAANGGKTEHERCPRNLTVEHVLPQSWQTHWPLPDHLADDPVTAIKRDAVVQTLGNLTLVTVALNPAMSNGPWSDQQAQLAGLDKGKRSALGQSVLLLNADLTKRENFNEQVIAERGESLARRAVGIWWRPAGPASPGMGSDDTAVQAVESPSVPQVSIHQGSESQPGPPEQGEVRAHETAAGNGIPSSHAGKYAALHRWLVGQDDEVLELRVSFTELEEVLGFPLPDSSRNHLAHWYGYDGSAVARALADAGWKASQVNLTAETVLLRRVVTPAGSPTDGDAKQPQLGTLNLGELPLSGPTSKASDSVMYGRSADEWEELEAEGHAFLVEKARAGDYTNYTELSDELVARTGLRRFDFADASERAAVGYLLGRVAERDLPTTGALITAIVIYLHGNDPGAGFYNLAKEKGLLPATAGSDQRLAFWVGQVKRIHAYYSRRPQH